MSRFILASASPARQQLLKQIGYEPDLIIPADIDESEMKEESPRNLALRLSYQKCLKISLQYPDDIILGADTVAAAGRLILPKACSESDALYSIKKISGRRHRVYTGICLIHKQKIIKRVGLSIVKMKRLSSQEIEFFIKTHQWRDKAGGFSLRGFAGAFIEQINGTDSNIMGLPLCITYKALTSIGLLPNAMILT